MTRWFRQWYSDADLVAHFILATCLAAALNFFDIWAQMIKASVAAGSYVVNGQHFSLTVCYLRPPAPFYPRLIVFAALLIASFGVLTRASSRSLLALLGLGGALAAYGCWWTDSYRVYLNLTYAGIDFFNNTEIQQTAYLYQGTPLDLLVGVSTVTCLALTIARLFDSPPVKDHP